MSPGPLSSPELKPEAFPQAAFCIFEAPFSSLCCVRLPTSLSPTCPGSITAFLCAPQGRWCPQEAPDQKRSGGGRVVWRWWRGAHRPLLHPEHVFALLSLVSQHHRATHKAPIQSSASFCYNSDLGISPSSFSMWALFSPWENSAPCPWPPHVPPAPTPVHIPPSCFLGVGNSSWL